MTLAQLIAAMVGHRRDHLVEAVEDALERLTAAEVFLVTAYFCALAIADLPCGARRTVLDAMPRILRDIIANETDTVTPQ